MTTTTDPQPMYNFTVATAHTYFAGDGEWLVHNSNCKQVQKSIDSLEKNIAKHEQKLTDHIANPDAYDNKGILKNAPEDRRRNIIEGRIKHLQGEIDNWRSEVERLKDLLKKADE